MGFEEISSFELGIFFLEMDIKNRTRQSVTDWNIDHTWKGALHLFAHYPSVRENRNHLLQLLVKCEATPA